MARRRFNPRQPRDRNGKWTKGGGGSSSPRIKSKAKKRVGNNENLQRAAGNALGAAFSASTGRPLMAGLHTTAATAQLYHVASNIAARRVSNNKKLSSAQKRNFTVKRQNIDRLVTKVEKAAELGIAAGVVGGVLGQGIAYGRSGPIPGVGVKVGKALGSGGAGLKFKRPSRGGVYNITSVKR